MFALAVGKCRKATVVSDLNSVLHSLTVSFQLVWLIFLKDVKVNMQKSNTVDLHYTSEN